MNKEKDALDMPSEIDFSDSVPNPYVGHTRRHIARENIDYFKVEAEHADVPDQAIIDISLTECHKQ